LGQRFFLDFFREKKGSKYQPGQQSPRYAAARGLKKKGKRGKTPLRDRTARKGVSQGRSGFSNKVPSRTHQLDKNLQKICKKFAKNFKTSRKKNAEKLPAELFLHC